MRPNDVRESMRTELPSQVNLKQTAITESLKLQRHDIIG